MLKILIVDDEQEKRRLITECLLTIDGLSLENLTVVTDVLSAKRAIASQKFDLLILDINLPRRVDSAPERQAGLDLLSFIRNNERAHPPTYIVGMTAYADSAEAALSAFTSALWKLLVFSYQDSSWEDALKEAVRYLVERDVPPYATDGETFHVDLGIVVALEEELTAMRSLPADWQPLRVKHDPAAYFRGLFKGIEGSVSVIAAAAPRMGMPAAGPTAAKLIQTFRPRFLAITGICAGVRGKVELGDILVADPCFDWGSGKWVVQEGKLRFKPALYPWRLDEPLRRTAADVANESGVLRDIHSAYEGPKPAQPPKLVVDAMASGASVIQAQELVDEVRDLHKNLVGIEMESYAVLSAAQYASDPRPNCISIKAVCDFADAEKNDNFHEYAAYASARFLFELCIRRLGPLLTPVS